MLNDSTIRWPIQNRNDFIFSYLIRFKKPIDEKHDWSCQKQMTLTMWYSCEIKRTLLFDHETVENEATDFNR
jgi:hypothetical protein